MHDYPIYNLDPLIIKDYFQALPRPPKKLFVRGVFPTDKHLVFLTVIGARDYSTYGKEACEMLIKGLRGYPVVIVSGLALGIDTIAHETAIDTGLTTIAFPGSGLDESIIYPRANRKLAEKILYANGCLLSEFENIQKTNDWLFPARNRLLAGISQATLINQEVVSRRNLPQNIIVMFLQYQEVFFQKILRHPTNLLGWVLHLLQIQKNSLVH